MVGRNDPCPCGSGKKYKKCHGKNTLNDMTTLVSEEIDRIVEGFVKESVHSANYHELEKRSQLWRDSLHHVFSDKLLDTIAMETYIYIDHPEFWKSYINKQLTKQHRQQVKDILQSWLQPVFLLAKVDSQSPEIIAITDLVTNKSYVMNGTPVKTFSGNWLFGIFMPDARKGENGLTATSSVVFIPDEKEDIVEALRLKLQNGYRDSLNLYHTFVTYKKNASTSTKEDHDEVAVSVEAEANLTPFTVEVLDVVQKYVDEYTLDASEFLELLTDFLTEEAVTAKKAETVAAGTILVGQAIGLISDGGLAKVKEIAGYFGVSPSSISRYRHQFNDFIIQSR